MLTLAELVAPVLTASRLTIFINRDLSHFVADL